jgi:tetratricopeptide (TPR) repeat protein
VLALACARAAAPPPPPPTSAALAATLIPLGHEALAEGDAATAVARFERAVAADPASPAARAGLGRALAAAGRSQEARTALEAALAAAPADADVQLGLAELAAQSGDVTAARAHFERAIASDPLRAEAHQRYAELTGPAPAGAGGDLLARAEAHPYDPAARLAAGELLLARGDAAAAREHLETALVLADLDPASGRRAAEQLRAYADWRQRRVIWVHAIADEALRADPAWRFQLRLAWLAMSQSLEPLTGARFALASTAAFRSEGVGLDLPPILAAARAQQGTLPSEGIVFVATGRASPRLPGAWKQGQAELLGRVLVVRLARGEVASRVLAHELVHLYGGVHVNPDMDALMNPSGTATGMDPWNAAILRATRGRRFGDGGIDRNVLPYTDLRALIAVYRAALRANVAMRNAGLLQALDANQGSLRAAARQERASLQLDEHLGDVAALLAQLLLRDGQRVDAAYAWASAAKLYGLEDPRGKAALRNARALERGAAR